MKFLFLKPSLALLEVDDHMTIMPIYCKTVSDEETIDSQDDNSESVTWSYLIILGPS